MKSVCTFAMYNIYTCTLLILHCVFTESCSVMFVPACLQFPLKTNNLAFEKVGLLS